MEWFFCLNDGYPQFEFAQVAVCSALDKTHLKPICIYSGDDQKKVDWFKANGVRVIRHQVSILTDIKESIYEKMLDPAFHEGAYLRIDIPLFSTEDYYLYTDTDVVFMDEVTQLDSFKPEYLAACCQDDPHNLDFFNNGVMLFNSYTQKRLYFKFVNWIREKITKKAIHWDQDAYNGFFAKRWQAMPKEFNWKAYWPDDVAESRTGVAPREGPVKILHFQGPKPLLLDSKDYWGRFKNKHAATNVEKWMKLYEHYVKT